jgi:3-deoxy-7-phosphoheptulonate synthase
MSSTPFPDDAERLQKYIEDRRVIGYDPLVQPALLKHDFPASKQSKDTIARARFAASRIIAGQDDRLLVIVGPCSIHDPKQALEYADLLKAKMPEWDGLLIIMRAYL